MSRSVYITPMISLSMVFIILYDETSIFFILRSYLLLFHLKYRHVKHLFESPSSRDIFCLKNFDTFIRTSVRVSKMNVVAAHS